ncbi:MAG: hypothetical protein H7A46_08535 [Verrucomicrobiales bacterium]|nr:hypothetical protein [Verrucomicrobiales bacterium]
MDLGRCTLDDDDDEEDDVEDDWDDEDEPFVLVDPPVGPGGGLTVDLDIPSGSGEATG